ncbi:MAG: cytochrome [Nevskia sp.]|nr:cytochrome [Nevskia sp.]
MSALPSSTPIGRSRREAENAADASGATEHRQVWDLPVRLFHWSLVTAFIASYVTNKLGVAYFKYHVWCGYTVIVLISFRILWGIVGTRHARFRNFVRGPAATGRYLLNLVRGGEQRYPGHNPLGALMVLSLLLTLLVQALTGLFANDEIVNTGPLYGYVSNERSLWLTSLHRLLFDWIFAAVVIHVLAVLAHHIARKERLVRAMLTGRKPAHSVPADEAIQSSRLWLALLLIVALSVALIWIVATAPVAEAPLF